MASTNNQSYSKETSVMDAQKEKTASILAGALQIVLSRGSSRSQNDDDYDFVRMMIVAATVACLAAAVASLIRRSITCHCLSMSPSLCE